jgi:hypothetical protein
MCKKMTNPSLRATKLGRGYPTLPKHLSYVKRGHLLTSPVKLISCGLSPFYKIGPKFLFSLYASVRSILLEGRSQYVVLLKFIIIVPILLNKHSPHNYVICNDAHILELPVGITVGLPHSYFFQKNVYWGSV